MSKSGVRDIDGLLLSRLSPPEIRTAAGMRAVRREFSRMLHREPGPLVFDVALQLARQDPGARFVAYELVLHHKAAFANLTHDSLLKFAIDLSSWSAVDCFGCLLSAPAWRDGLIDDALIREWTRSPDRWWRRVALVSTIALSRRNEAGDISRALEICRLLIADRDDMVVKAISWALREVVKKDPGAAQDFLAKHQGDLAARVTRETSNKLATGLKNPRR